MYAQIRQPLCGILTQFLHGIKKSNGQFVSGYLLTYAHTSLSYVLGVQVWSRCARSQERSFCGRSADGSNHRKKLPEAAATKLATKLSNVRDVCWFNGPPAPSEQLRLSACGWPRRFRAYGNTAVMCLYTNILIYVCSRETKRILLTFAARKKSRRAGNGLTAGGAVGILLQRRMPLASKQRALVIPLGWMREAKTRTHT